MRRSGYRFGYWFGYRFGFVLRLGFVLRPRLGRRLLEPLVPARPLLNFGAVGRTARGAAVQVLDAGMAVAGAIWAVLQGHFFAVADVDLGAKLPGQPEPAVRAAGVKPGVLGLEDLVGDIVAGWVAGFAAGGISKNDLITKNQVIGLSMSYIIRKK